MKQVVVCLLPFLIRATLTCDMLVEYREKSFEELHDLAVRVAGRMNCTSPEIDFRRPKETSHNMLNVWRHIGHALMSGFGCDDWSSCTDRPSCTEVVDGIIQAELVINNLQARYAAENYGRYGGNLNTYPIGDGFKHSSTDDNSHHRLEHFKTVDNLESLILSTMEKDTEINGPETNSYLNVPRGKNKRWLRKRSHHAHGQHSEDTHPRKEMRNNTTDDIHVDEAAELPQPQHNEQPSRNNHGPLGHVFMEDNRGHMDNHYQLHPSDKWRPGSDNLPPENFQPRGPLEITEHQPESAVNYSFVAMRLLFAAIGYSSSRETCGHGMDYWPISINWVDQVCHEVESGSLSSEILARELTKLDHVLRAAMDSWKPEKFFWRIMGFDSSDGIFIQQYRPCFQFIPPLERKPSRIPIRGCHHELHEYLAGLTTTIFVHLLQGHRPVTNNNLCPEQFLKSIFEIYEKKSTESMHVISVEGLQTMLDDAHGQNTTQGSDPRDRLNKHKPESETYNFGSFGTVDDWRHRPHEDSSRHIRSETCSLNRRMSARELVEGFLNDTHNGVNMQQFYILCPALLQQMMLPPDIEDINAERNSDTSTKESAMQRYGLGTVCVAVISLCSVVGAVLVKVCRGVGQHYAMAAMLAWAVGNLSGFAILHLIPEALRIRHHDHRFPDTYRRKDDDDGDSSDPDTHRLAGGLIVWDVHLKCLGFLASIYLFWLLEMITATIQRYRKADKDSRHESITATAMSNGLDITLSNSENRHVREVLSTESLPRENEMEEYQVESSRHLVWLVIVGNAVHKLANGLAIGAAFSDHLVLGLSTSVAVVCHELPHELGNIAVLVSTGMKVKKALLLNLLSALSAFVGLYIGQSTRDQTTARQCIYIIVAGMFLYIALANLIPELVRYFRHFQNFLMFTVQSVGLLTGFVLMFILRHFGHSILILLVVQLSHWRPFHEMVPLTVFSLGTANVLIISLISLLGGTLIKLCHGKRRLEYIRAALVTFATSSMIADTILHHLPHAFDLHERVATEKSMGIDSIRTKSLALLAIIYLFWLLQVFFFKCHDRSAMSQRISAPVTVAMKFEERMSTGHGSSIPISSLPDMNYLTMAACESMVSSERINSNSTVNTTSMPSDKLAVPLPTSPKLTSSGMQTDTLIENIHPHTALQLHSENFNELEVPSPLPRSPQNHRRKRCLSCEILCGFLIKGTRRLLWFNVVGEAMHNLADGMAIGGSFAYSLSYGLAISIGVFMHEIPHELENFSLLLATGATLKKALVLNLLSALTCFVGLYVGLAVGMYSELARQWVITCVAGIFVYIIITNLYPEMDRFTTHRMDLQMFLVQNVGLVSGFGLMFLVSMTEQSINL